MAETSVVRVSAKRLRVQIPLEIDLYAAINQLEEKIDLSEYVASIEEHKDGGHHLHVILIASKKQDIRNRTRLEIVDQGRICGCDCRVGSTYVIHYKHEERALVGIDTLLWTMSQQKGIVQPQLSKAGKSLTSVEKYLKRRLKLHNIDLIRKQAVQL